MVDTLGSGPSGCKPVGVQVPLSAKSPPENNYMQFYSPIEVLPSSVVEKIAAGEVVERPAAVLKEIVENSIDAGASAVDVVIEDAGFSLIKVTDNGMGMASRDLGKCMLRHATSKIRAADDLFSIGTMGFRGEALGSIAAVSRMTVTSATGNDGLGSMLACEGGELGKPVPHPHKRGTTVTIKDLFFNVPARKKFMKSQRGEHLAHIRMLEQLVIPFPTIHFTLTIDGKRIFDLPAVDRLVERIAEVAGPKFSAKLIECHAEREGLEATVFVTSPEQLQERPRFQSLYVNLRRINNDSVTYSIKEAFSQFLGHSNRPAFFCFLTIDPSRIDVNVHPTKQQIKFDDDRKIFSFIFTTVKERLGEQMVKSDAFAQRVYEKSQFAHSTDFASGYLPPRADAGLPVQGVAPMVQEESPPGNPFEPLAQPRGLSTDAGVQTILNFPRGKRDEKEVDPGKDNSIQLSRDVQGEMWDLIPCYQIHAMFILAPIKNGILLIDQHAAHERVLYEQALEEISGKRSTSQQLLFPIVLELSPAEKCIVESGMNYFETFGFTIADFGGNALSVSAIPAFLKDSAVIPTLRGMVKYLLEGRDPNAFTEPHKRFSAAFACGAAIKTGQKLTQEEMNGLLNNLFSAKNPYICPHGRPTLVRMSLDELARRFLR